MTSHKLPHFELDRFSAIAIGSSTGGPGLVEKIIVGLPPDLGVPVFVAQHMPPKFTESFAHQMDVNSALTVVHAEDGMPVFPGTVYVGVGKKHMRVKGIGPVKRIVISPSPEELLFMPSADELFRSCAEVYKGGTLAVVMTGIGKDGTEGARAVKAAGGVVVTQEKSTCAVYGMPRSCEEAGLSDAVLTPEKIRMVILQMSPEYHQKAAAG